MAVGTVQVVLNLDANNFNIQMRNAQGQLVNFGQSVQQASRSIGHMERALTGFGAKIRHTFVNLALVRTAMHNLWLATGAWQKSILDTAGELERMQRLLRGLSTASTIAEQQADAMKDFNYLVQQARSAPFTINEITNSFVKFKSVGLDPADGSLRSLLDAIAKFGGTDETLHRASVAIQQMAGKGVISMEELRQQLGEAVPSAMMMMARSMNMSVGNLVDAISKGRVIAVPALEKLFAQFRMTFGGSAQMMMDTYAGQMAKLKTQWTLFKDEVARSNGLFQESKRVLADLVMVLDPKYLGGLGDIYSKLALGLISGLRTAVIFIYDYRRELLALLKVLSMVTVAYMGMRAAAALWNAEMLRQVGLMATLNALTKGWGASLAAAWVATRNFAVATRAAAASSGIMSAALTALTGGFRALGVAVVTAFTAMKTAFLSNPVGWVLLLGGAIAGLVIAYRELTQSVDEARAALKRMANEGYVSDRDLRQQTARIREQAEYLNGLRASLAEYQAELRKAGMENDTDPVPGNLPADEQIRLTELREKIKRIKQVLAKGGRELQIEGELLSQAAARAMGQVAERLSAATTTNMARLESEITASFVLPLKAIDDAMATAGKDETQIKALTEGKKRIYEEQMRQVLAVYEKALNQQLALQAAAPAKEKAAYNDSIVALRDFIAQKRQLMQNDIDVLMRENVLGAGKDPNADGEDPLIGYLQSLRQKLAGYKAELEGEGSELAKFLEGLRSKFRKDDGDIARMTRAQQEAYGKTLAAEVDAYKVKVAEARKAAKEYADAQELVARWTGTSRQELEQINEVIANGGFELGDSRVRQFERAIGSLQATLDPAKFARLANSIAEVRNTLVLAAAQRQLMDLMRDERELVKATQLDKQAAFQEEMRQYQARQMALMNQNQVMGAERQKLLNQMYENMRLMQQQFELQTPLGQLATSWVDTTTAMQEATSSWLQNATEGLLEFVETGKFSFKDFAKSILKDILRIIMRALVAQAILSAIGYIRGGTVNSQGVGLSQNQLDAAYTDIASLPTGFAKGGIMTAFGPRMLKRYAQGGIARRPQLAIYGEGDKPEAYVPLPDGRTIPVTLEGEAGGSTPDVSVNVINQSGTPMNAEQRGQPRFDGRKMVLDVVLSEMNRPGPFRDAMRGAVR